MSCNASGEWTFFNREYLPLGWNSNPYGIEDNFKTGAISQLPIHTKYTGLANSKLSKLAHSEDGIRRNEFGDIVKIFFYNDGTNPQSSPKYWDDYFERIKSLSKCMAREVGM